VVFYNLVDALGYGEGSYCKMAYLCEEVRSKMPNLSFWKRGIWQKCLDVRLKKQSWKSMSLT